MSTPDFDFDPAIGPTGSGYLADTSRRLPPPPPSSAEWRELTELVAEAIHQMSHTLHSIARDVAALRAKVDALAPVAEGLARGGRLGAWSASRAARKDGGTTP